MNVAERGCQIWPVLTLAATNRQVVPYKILPKLIGVPKPGLGQLLEPIQSYCLQKKLPAITSLVVGDESGVPGPGFTAGTDIPREQMKAFEHKWLEEDVPTPQDLENALVHRPSRSLPNRPIPIVNQNKPS